MGAWESPSSGPHSIPDAPQCSLSEGALGCDGLFSKMTQKWSLPTSLKDARFLPACQGPLYHGPCQLISETALGVICFPPCRPTCSGAAAILGGCTSWAQGLFHSQGAHVSRQIEPHIDDAPDSTCCSSSPLSIWRALVRSVPLNVAVLKTELNCVGPARAMPSSQPLRRIWSWAGGSAGRTRAANPPVSIF